MRKIALTSTFVLSLLLAGVNAIGQAKAPWVNKEFTDPDTVPVQAIETYINDTCGPSGLDGIQVLAVQNGNGVASHMHVYCRQDKAASTHYKVTLPAITSGSVFGAVSTEVTNPNVKIGPFFFGKERAQDSYLLIEKTQ